MEQYLTKKLIKKNRNLNTTATENSLKNIIFAMQNIYNIIYLILWHTNLRLNCRT